MAPEIGEHILVGDEKGGKPREQVVVGIDAAGNPVTIPETAARSQEALDAHLGVGHALAIRARVLAQVA